MGHEILYHYDVEPDEEGATRDDFEVLSRVLEFDEECFNEVRIVFHVMGKYANPPFAVNEATRLHIPVGSSKQPYTLEWLQGFTQLVTAFEHENRGDSRRSPCLGRRRSCQWLYDLLRIDALEDTLAGSSEDGNELAP